MKKMYRDRYGRFTKRGSKLKPPQPRDKRGRYLPRKRKPVRRKKKTVKKTHLSPKRKPSTPPLRFRPAGYEEDEELGSDDLELEQEWQEQWEDDYSALDLMDDLDNLVDEGEWYES